MASCASQVLLDQEKKERESSKQAADQAASELRQEAAKRQRLEDTNKVRRVLLHNTPAPAGMFAYTLAAMRSYWSTNNSSHLSHGSFFLLKLELECSLFNITWQRQSLAD